MLHRRNKTTIGTPPLLLDLMDTTAGHVNCLWWDHNDLLREDSSGLPVFRYKSPLPIEVLVHNVGKHLSLGLYTLAQNFCATPDTLTIMITTSIAEGRYSASHYQLALELAVDPTFLQRCDSRQRSQLLETGLVLVTPSLELTEAPFPSLHSITRIPDSTPSPSPSPSPPASPSGSSSPRLQKPALSVGLHFLSPDSTNCPWRGCRVGQAFGFGPTSSPHLIVAEFGRQLGPEFRLHRIISITATETDVTIIASSIESSNQADHDNRFSLAFQLLKGGGQPFTAGIWEQAVEVGLLDA